MRKVLFKHLLDVSAPFGLRDNASQAVLRSTGLAKREKGISDSRVVTTASNSHQGNEGRQLPSQLHDVFGHDNWMFRAVEEFSSENVFVFYMSCVTSSEGAVLAAAGCHSGARQPKPNQSRPRSPRWATAGSLVYRDTHLQLVRSFSVDNAGVIFKITTYICE